MRHPLNSVFITQEFGGNPETYKQFGLAGHNGLDYRARNGTNVYAVHSGVVSTGFDEKGYGNYLKITNAKEESTLAHLKEHVAVSGKFVNEGDLVALSDNTGFSTAAHLHWTYKPLPKNNNGFGGAVDPTLLIGVIVEDMPVWLVSMFSEKGIDVKKPEGEVRGKVQEIFDNAKRYTELERRVKDLEKQLAGSAGEAAEMEQRYITSQGALEDARKELERARGQLTSKDAEISDLTKKIEVVSSSTAESITQFQNKIEELEELVKNLTEKPTKPVQTILNELPASILFSAWLNKILGR